MAYYQNGSSVFWEDSNDKYRYKDGKKHKNIGDTWKHEYDGWVYVYYKNELQDAYEVNKKRITYNSDFYVSSWDYSGGDSYTADDTADDSESIGSGFLKSLPMYPYAHAANIAWQNGDYGHWLGNQLQGIGVGLFHIATLGKGSAGKNALSVSGKSLLKKSVKTEISVISKSDYLRIQNAASRINKPITVVGSRANGKATAFSDWDYIIEGGLKNSREWSKIKNSLPGARSIIDNTPRNIDILPGPVWPNYPHITIYPR